MIRHLSHTMFATLASPAIATLLPAASAYQHFQITDPATASTVSNLFPFARGHAERHRPD